MDNETDRQTDRQTYLISAETMDNETDRQTDRQIDRQTDVHKAKERKGRPREGQHFNGTQHKTKK